MLTAEQIMEARSIMAKRRAAARRQVAAVCAYPPCGAPIVGTARRRYCCASHRTMAGRLKTPPLPPQSCSPRA